MYCRIVALPLTVQPAKCLGTSKALFWAQNWRSYNEPPSVAAKQELGEHWSLSHDEFELLIHRTGRSRIGFATALKFFALEGRFPKSHHEIPDAALAYVSEQVDVAKGKFAKYSLTGRSSERDRPNIREYLGFHPATIDDCDELTEWLKTNVVPREAKSEYIL